MSLRKRGDAWHIDIQTPDGRRIRQSAGTTDRKAAQEYHDRIKAQLWEESRLGVKPSKMWDEAALRYLKEIQHKRSLSDDARQVRWWTEHLRGKSLTEITRDMVSAKIEAAHANPATRNRYVATIRALMRKAEREWEWIDRAPAFKTYSEPKGRIRWITHDEAKRLLEASPDWLHDMIEFSLATGLRQANVQRLTWAQVDMQRRTVFIPGEQFKNGLDFHAPLNSDAIAVIRRRIGRHQTHVFVDSRGNAIESRKAWIDVQWRRAVKSAGIEDFRWHDLRHTWASWHVMSGTDIYTLKDLGGWETIEMPMRYAHLSMDHLSHAAERVTKTAHDAKAAEKQKAG